VIAAIVVLAIVLLALFLTGVIPGLKGSTSSNSPNAREYAITFSESGLPLGTKWSITLGGTTESSTNGTIAFTEKNGSYPFTVDAVSGYSASPDSGSVVVNGAGQTVSITFSPVGPGDYKVTFTESGLPSGTTWSVNLASTTLSSNTTQIAFTEKNNTYAYSIGSVPSYTATPSSGNVTVQGAAVGVTVTFTAIAKYSGPQYPVTFEQTGLPAGGLWSALSDPKTIPPLEFGAVSPGATIEYSAPNGTYTWTAFTYMTNSNGTEFLASPYNGTYSVSGQPVTIHLTFLETFWVNFTATGLTGSYFWNLSIDGATAGDSGPRISFQLPNGTYQYSAACLGYAASPPTGSITVQNESISPTVTFTKVPTYPTVFTETGLTSGSWDVSLNYPGGEMDMTNTSGSPVDFYLPVGTYTFFANAGSNDYWAASPASGNITVTSPGVAQLIVFSAITTYSVLAVESGLAPSTDWILVLNTSFGHAMAPGNITVNVPAGLNFYAAFATGYNSVQGNLTVEPMGTNTLEIMFTPAPSPTEYNVSFDETGLPSLGVWEISVVSQGSTTCPASSCFNSSLAGAPTNLWLPTGNYSWIAKSEVADFTASPMAGYFSVDGASPPLISVTFVNSSADYLVAFVQELYYVYGVGGLPNGTSWSVTLGGQTEASEGMFLFFLMPNGTTNAYTITAPAGYVAIQSFGNVTGYFSPYQGDFSFFPPVSPEVALEFEPKSPVPGVLATVGGASLAAFLSEYSIDLARHL
jgi:hypothetical protein